LRSKIRSVVDSLQDSGMSRWVVRSDGRLELGFLSEEDFLSFMNGVMVPIARQFGGVHCREAIDRGKPD